MQNREDNLEKSDGDDGEWEYVEAGPAEIIWKGNEITVKKKTIKVPKANAQKGPKKEVQFFTTYVHFSCYCFLFEFLLIIFTTFNHINFQDAERPTSNPLPPQSEAFSSHMNVATVPAEEVLNKMAQETPNFGTEQVLFLYFLYLHLEPENLFGLYFHLELNNLFVLFVGCSALLEQESSEKLMKLSQFSHVKSNKKLVE